MPPEKPVADALDKFSEMVLFPAVPAAVCVRVTSVSTPQEKLATVNGHPLPIPASKAAYN